MCILTRIARARGPCARNMETSMAVQLNTSPMSTTLTQGSSSCRTCCLTQTNSNQDNIIFCLQTMNTQTVRRTGLKEKCLSANSFLLQLWERKGDSGGEGVRVEGVASHSLPLSYTSNALSALQE